MSNGSKQVMFKQYSVGLDRRAPDLCYGRMNILAQTEGMCTDAGGQLRNAHRSPLQFVAEKPS